MIMSMSLRKTKKKTNKIKKPDKKESPKKATKIDANKYNELINEKEADINSGVFKKHFSFRRPSDMLKAVYTTTDRSKNKKLVNVIKSGSSDLKNEIEKMSDDEIEIEETDKTVDIVKEIIEYNRQNQEEQGLKILTPGQIFSRLPITLAQLKAGKNSEKLKNEIRQLLYSLYRSKKLTKTIYNNLINTI